MEPPNIVTPQSWGEVYEVIFEDSYNDRISRFKSSHAFRGVSSTEYSLQTSLMRLGGEYEKVETHLLRQFRKYAYRHMTEKHNSWYWISVAQHYGLPTRLLDWTYSPDVALHFATVNTSRFDTDGAVWRVNYRKLHEILPDDILDSLGDRNTWVLTTESMNKFFRNLKKLNRMGEKVGDFFLFFEPPSIDDRIFNQFAYFSVGSNPRIAMDDWLQQHPELWQKIVIKKELKWEIRDKLDQKNMSERVLFPGLDGLAQWLKRYYLPTGSAAIHEEELLREEPSTRRRPTRGRVNHTPAPSTNEDADDPTS